MGRHKDNYVVVNATAGKLVGPDLDPGLSLACMTLLPGENDVPGDVWMHPKNKGNVCVKSWLAAEDVYVLKDRKSAKPLDAGLSGLNETQARAKVGMCEDVSVLRDWLRIGGLDRDLESMVRTRIDHLVENQTTDPKED